MDEMKIEALKEKLDSILLQIKHSVSDASLISPKSSALNEIKNCLNEIFEGIICTDILFTYNSDKLFFGLTVNPIIDNMQALSILTTTEDIQITKYQLEIDSKLLDIDLTTDEIIALLLYEISSRLAPLAVNEVRNLINIHVLSEEDTVSIRDSINYSQLLIYAIKDTMFKVSSFMFKEETDDFIANKYIQEFNLSDALISSQEKILSSPYGLSDTIRSPKTVVLQWMFMVYKDISHNMRLVKDTLIDALELTASVLIKVEIEKTIKALDRIGFTVAEGVSLTKLIEEKKMSSVNEISLFKSLKQSGLRAMEDDLYEYTIKAKAAEDEAEAMNVLHSINTRLSIIEDYLYNTPDISEADRTKYEMLAKKYRALRDFLANKKIINRKRYGVFIDYSQFDKLEEN